MESRSIIPSPLGEVHGIQCHIAISDMPWLLDIDAIVLSVGASLGQLGIRMKQEFPGQEWASIDYYRVTPEHPVLFQLPPHPTSSLVSAVLASPHAGESSDTTARSIAVATDAAIRAAARAGAKALGLPLLATGTLGYPVEQVASIAVPAAISALRSSARSGLKSLVFIGMDAEILDAIRRAWTAGDTEAEQPLVPKQASSAPAPSPEFSDTELAGGISGDLVKPDDGIPLERDQLEVTPYVSMLATVIADRNTPLPLSVGIFGEWGSGKSYFMGLLRRQVETLADSGSPAYCRRIDQIGFNAWHYADSNLWASLGDEIFRQLAEPKLGMADRRRKLQAELTGRLHERRQLESATEQARLEAAALQASVDEATADRETGARELITALKNSPAAGKALKELWRRLGVSDDIEQGKLLAEQMRGTLTETEALRRAPWDRRGKFALAMSAVLLVTGAFAAVLVPAARELLAGLGGGVVTAVAGAGLTAVTAARSGLRKLRELTEDLHTGLSQAAERSEDVVEKLDALRQAEANQRIAEAQLSEVVSRVGELGRQLAELTPGRRLYTFLADRAQSNSYSGNLGLISTIRKDFEQLVELMKEWRDEGAEAAATNGADRPVERIVLYIDDLDRCSPKQVVDVLQAVHLLLAMELFVVVVGVDPRWLIRSLCSHYDEILEGDGATTAGGWQVTPEDYLEKILNIPLVLPGMSAGSLNRLLRSMVGDGIAATGNGRQGSPPPDPTENIVQAAAQTAEIHVEAGSVVAEIQQGSVPAQRIPRPLTDPELTLLAALEALVDTPREAKRLVNLYRMIRSTRNLSEASQFLGTADDPGEFQAVVVLLGLLTAHARLLGQVLDTPPQPDLKGGLVHRAPNTGWSTFVEDFEPKQSHESWTNGIAGTLKESEVQHWSRLHHGVNQVSAAVKLPDVSTFQLWVPRIRRFSYVLSPLSGQPAYS
jgi:hypothetical protein